MSFMETSFIETSIERTLSDHLLLEILGGDQQTFLTIVYWRKKKNNDSVFQQLMSVEKTIVCH